jgi:hypothetical protein
MSEKQTLTAITFYYLTSKVYNFICRFSFKKEKDEKSRDKPISLKHLFSFYHYGSNIFSTNKCKDLFVIALTPPKQEFFFVILIRLFHFWTNSDEIHFSVMIDKVHFLTVPHFS